MTAEEFEALKKQNEELQAKLADAGKANADDETRKRLQHLEDENKQLIEARDKAKQARREAEEAALAEQGQFKEIAEQRQKELEALQKKVEESNGVLDKYRQRDESELAVLMEKVPEALRDSLDDSIPLAKRLDLARKLVAEKPPGPGARPAGDPQLTTLEESYRKAVESGNVAEQITLKRQMYEERNK